MRSALRGLLRSSLISLDPAVVKRIRQLGFTVADATLVDGPDAITPQRGREIRSVFQAEGVDLFSLWVSPTNFIADDLSIRQNSIATALRAIKVGAALGCTGVAFGVGSHNPRGNWYSHPRNHALETQEVLATSLREVCKSAEDHGLYIALEPHILTAMDSPRRFLAVHRLVASPSLRITLDSTNFLTCETAYRSGEALTEQFDLLHDYILDGHCKDMAFEDKLLIYINSRVYPGDGIVDYPTFVKLMNGLPPRTPLYIEHVPEPDVPRVKAFLDKVVSEAGITWVQ